ncbi:MAG: lipid-A-disaccharide synthase [Candidatus Omnitrophota bacterium]
MPKKILIIAGEASGDLYGAQLVKSLKQQQPSLGIFAMGGKLMQQAGAEIICDISQFAVIGFFEVLKNIQKFKSAFKLILSFIRTHHPAALVLIDFPGFNLRLAKKINKSIPVIYYISPQLWAWGKNRLSLIKRYVTQMLVIFEFEKKFYKSHGIEVIYLGHPLLELIHLECSQPALFARYRLYENKHTIGLMPGSRLNEIKKILPLLLNSAALIKNKIPEVQFVLIKAETIELDIIRQLIKRYKINITIIETEHYAAVKGCELVLACSGTATVELALMEVPMIIVYKTTLLTWLILKLLIKVKFIGMVNIIANEKVVSELIQFQANPKTISHHALKLLHRENNRADIREKLRLLKENFLPHNASERAAEIIISYLA